MEEEGQPQHMVMDSCDISRNFLSEAMGIDDGEGTMKRSKPSPTHNLSTISSAEVRTDQHRQAL